MSFFMSVPSINPSQASQAVLPRDPKNLRIDRLLDHAPLPKADEIQRVFRHIGRHYSTEPG